MMNTRKKSQSVFEKNIFPRDTYIQKLKTLTESPRITVLQGQRRVGKSSIVVNFLQQHTDRASVFYINKEYDSLQEIPTHKELEAVFDLYVQDHTDPAYIVIDEIQNIIGREHFIRAKNAESKYHIIITGSNGDLLSSELATYLTGRYITLDIYPLSYTEYLSMSNITDSRDAFFAYIEYGGLPEIVLLPHNDQKKQYATHVLSDIILKDIVTRFKTKNIKLFYQLLRYFATTMGKISSLRNITNYLQSSEDMDHSVSTISNYTDYLCMTYLVHRVSRYDLVGKATLQNKDKYFFTDLGIKHSITYNPSTDLSGILENLVYLHYKRLGYKVYVGEMRDKEIDFVAIQGEQKIYIQVAVYILEEKTRKREFGNLLAIKDNFPKIVVSLDDIPPSIVDGIHLVSIRNLLLGGDGVGGNR